MTPEAFRALRRHLGIKQSRVAEIVRVSKASVCNFERKKPGAPPPERFHDAAERLLRTWEIWRVE